MHHKPNNKPENIVQFLSTRFQRIKWDKRSFLNILKTKKTWKYISITCGFSACREKNHSNNNRKSENMVNSIHWIEINNSFFPNLMCGFVELGWAIVCVCFRIWTTFVYVNNKTIQFFLFFPRIIHPNWLTDMCGRFAIDKTWKSHNL